MCATHGTWRLRCYCPPMMYRTCLVALAACTLVAGCSKSESSTSETPDPSELVEYDLSPAGDTWKGWTASGPKGCKVMGDLGNAARIACDGPDMAESAKTGRNGFDLLFVQGAEDLSKVKDERKARWDAKAAAGEHAILADEPSLLAWREGKGKFVAYQFMMKLDVAGQPVTCKPLHGGGIEAEHELHLAACRTLAKK